MSDIIDINEFRAHRVLKQYYNDRRWYDAFAGDMWDQLHAGMDLCFALEDLGFDTDTALELAMGGYND